MCYSLEEIKGKAAPVAESICIERGRLRSLLQYFAFVNELESIFKCHVDVITTEIEDKEFLEGILKERILLYEQQG